MGTKTPTIETYLPELTDFVSKLTSDVTSGKVDNWKIFSDRTQEFYTPTVMQHIDTVIPGWIKMASYSNNATLIHVTSALIALNLLPEYQQATPEDKTICEWIVLLHDISKEIYPGKRDHGHGFRSAVMVSQLLPEIGFPMTNDYEKNIEKWTDLTQSAIKLTDDGDTYFQDNHMLPEIFSGIDKLFGKSSSAALIVKAILLHLSINSVSDWPQVAPLSDSDVQRYMDEEFIPYLEIINLVDNDAWALFNDKTKERHRQETLVAFQKVRVLANTTRRADLTSFG